MSWSEKDNPGYQYKGEQPVFPPEVPRPKGRKNTKAWCKGKIGRHHDPVPRKIHHYGLVRLCQPPPQWAKRLRSWPDWWCQHWMVCRQCGKHLSKVPAAACPDRHVLVDRNT